MLGIEFSFVEAHTVVLIHFFLYFVLQSLPTLDSQFQLKEQVRYHISNFGWYRLEFHLSFRKRMEWFLNLLDLFFSVCVFSSVCLRVWHVLSKLVDCVIRLMRGNTNTSYFLSTAQSLQSSITFEFLKIFSLSQSSRNDEKLWKFYERVIPHYRVRWHPTTHDSHSLNDMLNKKVFGKIFR